MEIAALHVSILRAPNTGRPHWVSHLGNGVLTLKEQPRLGLALSEAAVRKFGEKIL
jgi:hypothetical protein